MCRYVTRVNHQVDITTYITYTDGDQLIPTSTNETLAQNRDTIQSEYSKMNVHSKL